MKGKKNAITVPGLNVAEDQIYQPFTKLSHTEIPNLKDFEAISHNINQLNDTLHRNVTTIRVHHAKLRIISNVSVGLGTIATLGIIIAVIAWRVFVKRREESRVDRVKNLLESLERKKETTA